MSYESNRPKVGDYVRKRTGEYDFDGIIMAEWTTRKGNVRYIVEDDRGLSLIMNERQITNV